jgi:hypothetical protein
MSAQPRLALYVAFRTESEGERWAEDKKVDTE